MNHPTRQQDTSAWIFFVWTAFVSALLLPSLGIWYTPADWWVKGYLGLAHLYPQVLEAVMAAE
jgi:hypothetical protein